MRSPSTSVAVRALVVVPLLLSACASSEPSSWVSTDPYMENANTKLTDRVGWIQFFDGRTVSGATRVSVGRVVIRWQAGGRVHEAPTASVLRIGVEPKERTGRQIAVVAAALLAVGASGGSTPTELPRSEEGQERADSSALGRFLAPMPGEIVWEARKPWPATVDVPPPAD